MAPPRSNSPPRRPPRWPCNDSRSGRLRRRSPGREMLDRRGARQQGHGRPLPRAPRLGGAQLLWRIVAGQPRRYASTNRPLAFGISPMNSSHLSDRPTDAPLPCTASRLHMVEQEVRAAQLVTLSGCAWAIGQRQGRAQLPPNTSHLSMPAISRSRSMSREVRRSYCLQARIGSTCRNRAGRTPGHCSAPGRTGGGGRGSTRRGPAGQEDRGLPSGLPQSSQSSGVRRRHRDDRIVRLDRGVKRAAFDITILRTPGPNPGPAYVQCRRIRSGSRIQSVDAGQKLILVDAAQSPPIRR